MKVKLLFQTLWKKRAAKVGIIAAGLLIVFVLALVLGWIYLTKSSLGLFGYDNPYNIPGATVPGSVTEISRGGQRYTYNKDVVSVLLLGVDGANQEGDGYAPQQADTIILLSINIKTGQIDMLPIPRDIEVPIMHFDLNGEYAYTQPGPICTAHSFGANREMAGQLMGATVSYLMYNIPISCFVSVGMEAISHATDFVGGVPVQVYEDFQEISGVEAGEWYTLDGEMAELYVRGRNLRMMDGSNLSRMVRQREFLFALLGVVKQKTKENVLFPLGFYRELSPYIETDMSLHEIAFCGNMGLQNSDFINLHIMEGETVRGKTQEVEYIVDEAFLQSYVLDIYYLPVE